MGKHTIASVIEGDLFSVLLRLEGERIDLNYNGSTTYNSTNVVDVSGALSVAVVARGVPGADWKVTISEGAKKLVDEQSLKIGPGNLGTFGKNVTVAETDDAEAAPAASSKKAGGKAGGKAAGKAGRKGRG